MIVLNAGGWYDRLPEPLKRLSLPLSVWDHIAALDDALQRSLERELQLNRRIEGAQTETQVNQ